MTFQKYFFFNKTALHIAVEKGDPDIVQNLLLQEKVDVNAKSIEILNLFIFNSIPINFFFE